MQKKPTTLKDIATDVGVSVNAVSFVLNARKACNIGVSSDTRSRILASARRLNYQRNMAAAHLAGVRTKTVGVLVTNLMDALQVPVVDAFECEAIRNGYNCFLGCTRYDGTLKFDYVKNFLQHGVDGMLINKIWNLPEFDQAVDLLRQTRIPLVFIHNVWPGFEAPMVRWDNLKAGRLIGRHVLEVGHRSLAFLTYSEDSALDTVQERIRGIREEMKAFGLDPQDLVVLSSTYGGPREYADLVMSRLQAPNPPTVILASEDVVAIELMMGLNALGCWVPKDLAVTGFDDFLSPFLHSNIRMQGLPFPWMIPLTTVRRPYRAIGTRAFSVMMGMIEGGNPMALEDHALEPELVVRESSQLPTSARSS